MYVIQEWDKKNEYIGETFEADKMEALEMAIRFKKSGSSAKIIIVKIYFDDSGSLKEKEVWTTEAD